MLRQAAAVHLLTTSRPFTGRSERYLFNITSNLFRFDNEEALAEIRRVLKPGGKLALVWNIENCMWASSVARAWPGETNECKITNRHRGRHRPNGKIQSSSRSFSCQTWARTASAITNGRSYLNSKLRMQRPCSQPRLRRRRCPLRCG